MVGVVGKAIKGLGLLGKALKHGSKQRKGIRKLPFGKFVDFPIEVATKHKKTAIKTAPIGGAAAAGVAYGERKSKK